MTTNRAPRISEIDMAKTLPGKVARTTSRAGLGGGALLIALALFLLFRGFGPGGTGATGSGTGQNTDGTAIISTAPQGASSSAQALDGDRTAAPGLTAEEKKALSGETLTVLIDEHDFLLGIPGDPAPIYRPTPLPRIVELATFTKGNSSGIRIQILRRESARASAEEELKLELDRKGIHSDAIVMPSEFVP